MQLINHIGSNATNGKIILGMIPATGLLLKCRSAIQRRLGIKDEHKDDLNRIISTAQQALSILSTVSLVSLPFSTEKKVLFAVVCSLAIASPFGPRIVQKFGGSEKKANAVRKISLVCILVTRIWTMFMVSAAVGFKIPNNSSHVRAAIVFTMLGLHNKIFVQSLLKELVK